MKTNRWLGIPILMTALLGLLPLAAYAAAPTVVTVPWRGPLNLPHETYNGKAVFLKGVAHGVTTGATATWDPGDGTPPVAIGVSPGSNYTLEKLHTYPNSADGTPYTAKLKVCNPGNECTTKDYKVVVKNRSLDVEINVAIDQALWFSHKQQNKTTGAWAGSGYLTDTASSIQSFEINNHLETGNASEDPYVDTVSKGLKNLFAGLSTMTLPLANSPAGNPEAGQIAPNGYGVQVTSSGSYAPYVLGMVMDAIVASKTPNAVTTTGQAPSGANPGILGRTYKSIVQDMVDSYAWGQVDPATGAYRGGWRYGWNYSSSDNSASQWGAIGILAARDLFGCTVPSFVYSENLNWLNYSAGKSGSNYVYFGYDSPSNYGAYYVAAESPSGLVQLIMDGVPKTDAVKWTGVENNMAANWGSYYQDSSNYYALFALAKSMRLALPSPIVQMAQGTPNQIDWFAKDCPNPAACTGTWGVARTIIRDQNAATGQFAGDYAWIYPNNLSHAWGTIILTGTLHLEPVAVAKATPNPGAVGQTITFDGTGSYHTDPARSIVSYEWDLDNNGTFETTGMTASRSFTCAVLPCSYKVILKVTDNGTPTPLVDTGEVTVNITAPPHPPTANAGGPYVVCQNEQFRLDGSMSSDVDQPQGDSITAYGWELDFAQPLDYNEATGVAPLASFANAGTANIGLRVWDNTHGLNWGEANLTNEAFTTANVWDCTCIGPLVARAKPGKIDITWAPVTGAATYDIYRSTTGANSGFTKIKADYVSAYAVYADFGLTNGTTYWYRVVPKAATGASVCGGSAAASAKPVAR